MRRHFTVRPPTLGLCSLAHAEPATTFNLLEPVVVTGTYAPNQSFDLPYSIDTVERAQIADGQLGVNLSEALNRVPGLVVQNRQNYAQDLQISSRGYGARSAFGIRGSSCSAMESRQVRPTARARQPRSTSMWPSASKCCAALRRRFTAAMRAG